MRSLSEGETTHWLVIHLRDDDEVNGRWKPKDSGEKLASEPCCASKDT
jgi:hypothetical protein